mmetsp:Transcript_6263/g.19749  ORF Transcript_6263/g.19749 Transcript_6263/m.19749 type:complete len:216 (-) Transcript_6263:824-1471(-)
MDLEAQELQKAATIAMEKKRVESIKKRERPAREISSIGIDFATYFQEDDARLMPTLQERAATVLVRTFKTTTRALPTGGGSPQAKPRRSSASSRANRTWRNSRSIYATSRRSRRSASRSTKKKRRTRARRSRPRRRRSKTATRSASRRRPRPRGRSARKSARLRRSASRSRKSSTNASRTRRGSGTWRARRRSRRRRRSPRPRWPRSTSRRRRRR